MMLLVLELAMVACALAPAVMFCFNLRRYREPPTAVGTVEISVLIPARDEERNIEACLQHVLRSHDVKLEVLVMDDASSDATGALVHTMAATDKRIRLFRNDRLPSGWNGKQHACWVLARHARFPLLLFLDADVRITPDAVVRCAAALRRPDRRISLVSGFPRLITGGWMERLLLPLIHFVLLGFLPMRFMQSTTRETLGAGCGQFLLTRREEYFRAGGHAAIRETRHDGLRLPQLFRHHGLATDLVDLTAFAEVRMYDSAGAVWSGLSKNATEGIAAPRRILPFTLILFLGQVLPFIIVATVVVYAVLRRLGGPGWGMHGSPSVRGGMLGLGAAALLGAAAGYGTRLAAVSRFRQPLDSALLHPLGVSVFLLLEWTALLRELAGKPIAWRQRQYSTESGEEVHGSYEDVSG
ncbi:MAG TPA: glycosyltransferase family 2 protein [Acidobacteriaceae bacterium]|jgi:glycosyltransferase involved in cell wall biosynthesis|nr:glycosyltransferase family 2 protein [Acidobacteriaceae bacterium]